MSGKYRTLLAFWGLLFLTSSLILLVNWWLSGQASGTLQPPSTRPPGNELESGIDDNGDKPIGGLVPIADEGRWSLGLAAVSAFVSAAGFMTTTYFAMRSDRRQTALTQLQVQQLAHEIERQRLEIDRLKRDQEARKK